LGEGRRGRLQVDYLGQGRMVWYKRRDKYDWRRIKWIRVCDEVWNLY
jgi:hypothetical protein